MLAETGRAQTFRYLLVSCAVCSVRPRAHTIDLSTNYRRENYHRLVSSMHRRPCKYEKFFHTDNNVETGINDFVVSRTLPLSLSLKLSTKKQKWNVAPSTSIMRRPQIIARDKIAENWRLLAMVRVRAPKTKPNKSHFRKFDRIWRPKNAALIICSVFASMLSHHHHRSWASCHFKIEISNKIRDIIWKHFNRLHWRDIRALDAVFAQFAKLIFSLCRSHALRTLYNHDVHGAAFKQNDAKMFALRQLLNEKLWPLKPENCVYTFKVAQNSQPQINTLRWNVHSIWPTAAGARTGEMKRERRRWKTRATNYYLFLNEIIYLADRCWCITCISHDATRSAIARPCTLRSNNEIIEKSKMVTGKMSANLWYLNFAKQLKCTANRWLTTRCMSGRENASESKRARAREQRLSVHIAFYRWSRTGSNAVQFECNFIWYCSIFDVHVHCISVLCAAAINRCCCSCLTGNITAIRTLPRRSTFQVKRKNCKKASELSRCFVYFYTVIWQIITRHGAEFVTKLQISSQFNSQLMTIIMLTVFCSWRSSVH